LPILPHFFVFTPIYCRFSVCEHLKKIYFAVDARIFHFFNRHILPFQSLRPQYIGGHKPGFASISKTWFYHRDARKCDKSRWVCV